MKMRAFLRHEALENVWRYEDNKDLYIGAARVLRKREGYVEEDPDTEEAIVLYEAKMLALKDAVEKKSGDRQERAADQAPRETIKGKSFGK